MDLRRGYPAIHEVVYASWIRLAPALVHPSRSTFQLWRDDGVEGWAVILKPEQGSRTRYSDRWHSLRATYGVTRTDVADAYRNSAFEAPTSASRYLRAS